MHLARVGGRGRVLVVSESIEFGIILRIVEFIVEAVEFVEAGRKAEGGEGFGEGVGGGEWRS